MLQVMAGDICFKGLSCDVLEFDWYQWTIITVQLAVGDAPSALASCSCTDQHILTMCVGICRLRHLPPANTSTGRCVRSTTCVSPTGVFLGLSASLCIIA